MENSSKILTEIWNHWYGKLLVTIIVIFLIIIIGFSVSKNLDIDIWGLKITHSKNTNVHDTIKINTNQIKNDTLKLATKNQTLTNPIIYKIPTKKIQIPLIKKDSPVINQPPIIAKNYAGTNNGGHVGDNYYGTEPRFTEADGTNLMSDIENYRRDSNIVSKSLIINSMLNSNSVKFGSDLYNWLKNKNYRVSIRTNRLMKEPWEGMRIYFDQKEGCFEIQIGNLPQ